MTQPIVKVEHIHKYFRRGSEQIDVLIDLSLDVPEGESLVEIPMDLIRKAIRDQRI